MNRKRKDTNHSEIVEACESVGASVLDLSNVGGGAPDISVGFRGKNFFLEIKRNGKQRLRASQTDFATAWRGQYTRVDCAYDALRAIGAVE
jgi:hypothetical protein